MKTFRTAKGTELPLLNLKGKEYLTVAYRILWMREEHPDWGIETEYLQVGPDLAIAKATVKDGSGRILAQGTKMETPKGFPDFVEKSESGAVGRALALCGYGTQFAQELDEGDRIVDAPQGLDSNKVGPIEDRSGPGAAIMTLGKNKGKRLDAIGPHDLDSWCQYMKTQPELSPKAKEMMALVENFLASREKSGNK